MSARYEFLDHGGVLAFAHRGGTNDWPENTMPAFQQAIDLGYRYLETDVHLSADGVLYAFHDDSLKRSTGVDGYIADLESAQIDRLLVDDIAPIPRLDEVLTAWPLARVNIDTKSDASVLPVVASLRAHRAIDRVCIGSFSDRRIKRCRSELGPELCTSMGPLEACRLVLASKGLADPSLLRAPCAQLPDRWILNVTTADLVETAHAHDIQVHVWTIDAPEAMHELLDIGVDGIMSDQSHVLREVLLGRGQWAATTTTTNQDWGNRRMTTPSDRPVVLLHGLGGSAATTWQSNGWMDLIADAGRSALGIDLLGHGSAAKPHDPAAYADMHQHVLDQLPAEPVDAIGFSLGSRVLLECAIAAPDRFARLVLTGVGANLLETRTEHHDKIAAAIEGNADPTDPFSRYFTDLANDPDGDVDALRALLNSPSTKLTVERLQAVTMPVLVLLGDNDFAGPADPLVDALENASFSELRRCDHFAHPTLDAVP